MFKLLLNFHVRADDVLRAFLITSTVRFDNDSIRLQDTITPVATHTKTKANWKRLTEDLVHQKKKAIAKYVIWLISLFISNLILVFLHCIFFHRWLEMNKCMLYCAMRMYCKFDAVLLFALLTSFPYWYIMWTLCKYINEKLLLSRLIYNE
jgi:hypothetical protein